MMRVGITGASGLVGRHLAARLARAGHRVIPFVRADHRAGENVLWDPHGGRFDASGIEPVDAVVHLAGESVASGRWTAARRKAIEHSRVRGTELLVEGLSAMPQPPRTLVCASASGIYGDQGEALCDESSPTGTGFLADVCRAWESASDSFVRPGHRRVCLRIGIVLAKDGGALPRMATPFRFFMGGPLGSGRQWMSWISLRDLCALFERALGDESLHGAVNAVSPTPIRNLDFARVLGRVLHRPSWFPTPRFALRIALGAMADELLLASTRLVPSRILEAGFRFEDTDLEATLRTTLCG